MEDKLKLLKAEKNGCFPLWLKNGKLGDLKGKKIWYGLNSKGETVGFYTDMTAYNFKTKKTAKWGCKSLKKSQKNSSDIYGDLINRVLYLGQVEVDYYQQNITEFINKSIDMEESHLFLKAHQDKLQGFYDRFENLKKMVYESSVHLSSSLYIEK